METSEFKTIGTGRASVGTAAVGTAVTELDIPAIQELARTILEQDQKIAELKSKLTPAEAFVLEALELCRSHGRCFIQFEWHHRDIKPRDDAFDRLREIVGYEVSIKQIPITIDVTACII